MRTDLPRVLIVEDEPTIAHAFAKIFSTWGWSAAKAFTVAEAIGRLNEPFQLIVLDMMLPDGSGREVLAAVHEAGHKTPVAITSARIAESIVEDLGDLKPDRIFAKPYVLDALQDYASQQRDAFYAALKA